jgi:hypothetical protein
MKPIKYTQEQLINVAQITKKDIDQINQCRREHNRLGFGYQLVFVRLVNRFPLQQPFEIVEEILVFISVQLGIPSINLFKSILNEDRQYLSIKKVFVII